MYNSGQRGPFTPSTGPYQRVTTVKTAADNNLKFRYEELVAENKHLRDRVGALMNYAADLEKEDLKLSQEVDSLKKKLRKNAPVELPGQGMLMKFGKYMGIPVAEVPESYALWLLSSMKDRALKEGRFNYQDDVLAAELLKVAYHGDVETDLNHLIQEHKAKYPTFDEDRFRNWLGKSYNRKLRCIWLGVAFYNRQRKKETTEKPA